MTSTSLWAFKYAGKAKWETTYWEARLSLLPSHERSGGTEGFERGRCCD